MSPYFWLLKGSVREPKLHKSVAETDPAVAKHFPVRPQCGTDLDRCCIEEEWDLSNHHIYQLCKRCFGKVERAELQRQQDAKDAKQRAWMLYVDQHPVDDGVPVDEKYEAFLAQYDEESE